MNVNGSCPGSFVDQNFLERSLSFPKPGGRLLRAIALRANDRRVSKRWKSEQRHGELGQDILGAAAVRRRVCSPRRFEDETRLCSGRLTPPRADAVAGSQDRLRKSHRQRFVCGESGEAGVLEYDTRGLLPASELGIDCILWTLRHHHTTTNIPLRTL